MNHTPATLYRIDSTHDIIRTSEIPGCFESPPKEGREFLIFGEPLDGKADLRMVRTSRIKKVETEGDVIRFWTQNSEYRLEVGPTKEPVGQETVLEFSIRDDGDADVVAEDAIGQAWTYAGCSKEEVEVAADNGGVWKPGRFKSVAILSTPAVKYAKLFE